MSEENQEENQDIKPVLVRVKPGTAAEKSMMFVLPSELGLNGLTIDKVVTYALHLREEDGVARDTLRIQERIHVEMKEKYGVIVNGIAIPGPANLVQYLQERLSPAGKQYLEAEIIIAARQEGAYRRV